MKRPKYFLPVLAILILIVSGAVAYFVYDRYFNKPEGLMLLIEFEDTEGLENMVSELEDRDIPSLLMVDSTFVTNNCGTVKKLQDKGVEIAGVYPQKPLWEVSYEEQKQVITDTKDKIEACTQKSMRVFGSKYFAYDENTVKAAEELGIEYVMARGTTKAKATIYKPAEYDVKIFSVSNVSSPSWGTGSLCDYSYWAREGNPDDFAKEMDKALEETKISPVSHTYIGGLKARWNEVYINFFDKYAVNWQDLDNFGVIDKELQFNEIPDNREVQYDQPKPAVPLEEEEDVMNPCRV